MKKATGQSLRVASRLAADGKPHEAIDVLEWELKQLATGDAIEDIVSLSLHAAIISEGGLKDDRRARRILRRALRFAPTDTKLLICLARLYQKFGKTHVARDLLNRRRETDEEKENVGLQELIEVMTKELDT
jgi:hypothetical protein